MKEMEWKYNLLNWAMRIEYVFQFFFLPTMSSVLSANAKFYSVKKKKDFTDIVSSSELASLVLFYFRLNIRNHFLLWMHLCEDSVSEKKLGGEGPFSQKDFIYQCFPLKHESELHL